MVLHTLTHGYTYNGSLLYVSCFWLHGLPLTSFGDLKITIHRIHFLQVRTLQIRQIFNICGTHLPPQPTKVCFGGKGLTIISKNIKLNTFIYLIFSIDFDTCDLRRNINYLSKFFKAYFFGGFLLV